MKKITFAFLALVSCYGVFAENRYPSREELKVECKKMKNGINSIESKIDSIHYKQIEKLSEQKDTNYSIDSLKLSNVEIYREIREILQMIPVVYAKDTTDNTALLQFQKLVGLYQKYYSATFNGTDTVISISGDFKTTINTVSLGLSEINETLKPYYDDSLESSDEETIEDYSSEGFSHEIWIIFALIFVLFVLEIMLIVSNRNINRILSTVNLTLDEIYDPVARKVRIPREDKPIENSRFKPERVSIVESHNIGQKEFEKIKSNLLDEINVLKEELDNVKKTLSQHISESKSLNLLEKEQSSIIAHSNEVNSPTTKPVVKGLYAQLQENGIFKIYDSDRQNAIYIITPKPSSETIGEFSLKTLSLETAKAVIENRQLLLMPACEIMYTSANPQQIKVESPGIVEKIGNEWRVKEKARISIMD